MEKLRNLLKKFRVPSFLVPKRLLPKIELLLTSANITFSASEWLGIFLTLGIFVFIIGSLLISLPVGIALFLGLQLLMYVIPKVQADKRRSKIEEALPDALHQMAVAIRSGLVLESVIHEIAEAEYGALSEEFARVIVEIRKGRSLKEALLGFAKRSGSAEIKRAITLLLEGIEAGGSVPEVLDEVADDLRAVRAVQRERKALTGQQISFLAMASLMAAPFVMGVVASLPTIMAAGGGGEQIVSKEMMHDINMVITGLTIYVVGQACSAAMMMSVVMYGNPKKGLKFMIPMGLAAYLVFTLVKKMMPGMIAAF